MRISDWSSDVCSSDLPSSSPSAPRRSEVRRGALIEAAGTLFVEQGVDATTVDDIAKRAGVAKGTFYHYSGSTACVLDALRERFSDQFISRIASAIAHCPAAAWEAKLKSTEERRGGNERVSTSRSRGTPPNDNKPK